MTIPILSAALGWLIGAGVNYLADVLPHTRRLSAPFCLHCGNAMGWREYLFWPRRCPSCAESRGRRAILVEAIFAALIAWLAIAPPANLDFFSGCSLLAFFGVVTVIDLEHRLILHPVAIAGAILGSVFGVLHHGWLSTLVGGAAGYAVMLGLYWFGAGVMSFLARRRGETLEEEALGFGDVNLAGVLGLILGWPGILAGLVLAILIGGGVSLVYLIYKLARRQYHINTAIPYGPLLIAGAALLLFFRDGIMTYLGW
ncbi:MAG: A24 family peptidase [Chloroflexi bacterium]|nr:A24 family peptidase [Chloroflexota bacterium]